MGAEFLEGLRARVGLSHVLTPPDDLSAFEVDHRKRWRGRALAVVRPASTEELSQVVRWCHHHGVPVVPQGGNTGLVGGSIPDDSGRQVLLSTQRLRRIRTVDTANLTLTAEAGCVLREVQLAAEAQGLWFPLSLASEGSCTIGGNLATNAGGTQVLRFGNARELCLGLEVVSPQGEVWSGLTGLRKDNTGYDLRGLLVGSEGTLGVITAATLKLFPLPQARCTALAACQDLSQAVALLNRARASLDASLTGFEVMNTLSMTLVGRHFPQIPQPLPSAPWTVLLEQSSPLPQDRAREQFEALLGAAMEASIIQDAVVAESLGQSKSLWHLRESISMAQAAEGPNIKHDIALPVSSIPDFVAQTDAALARAFPGIRLVNFGHLGDGNLHYNVQAPEGWDAQAFVRDYEGPVNRLVYDAVQGHGGSISAEHGIGALKVQELEERKSPVALAMMRSIKQGLDPKGLMNPGRVLATR